VPHQQCPIAEAPLCWCHCSGVHLDPVRVLQALPEEMPLQLAFTTLARMTRDRIHRRRHGQIIRNLCRADNLAASVERAKVGKRLRGRLAGAV
jgi:Vacuolar sorting protein 39 domain 2